MQELSRATSRAFCGALESGSTCGFGSKRRSASWARFALCVGVSEKEKWKGTNRKSRRKIILGMLERKDAVGICFQKESPSLKGAASFSQC